MNTLIPTQVDRFPGGKDPHVTLPGTEQEWGSLGLFYSIEKTVSSEDGVFHAITSVPGYIVTATYEWTLQAIATAVEDAVEAATAEPDVRYTPADPTPHAVAGEQKWIIPGPFEAFYPPSPENPDGYSVLYAGSVDIPWSDLSAAVATIT